MRAALLTALLLVALVLAACTGNTSPGATNVTTTTATERAAVTCNQGESGAFFFRQTSDPSQPVSTWPRTADQPYDCSDGPHSAPVSADVTGLTPATTYSYVYCGTVTANGSTSAGCLDRNGNDANTAGRALSTYTTQSPPPPSEPDYDSAAWRPYAAGSPFNKPVGPNPTPTPATSTHADSAHIIAHILAGSSSTNGPGAFALDDPANEVSHARFHAKSTDPSYRVVLNNSWCTAGEGDTIRIPAGAQPSGGINNPASWWDGHMSVTQPRNANGQIIEYDFYQVRQIGGGTITADCGDTEDAENGDGSVPGASNTTVANFALMAGQVKASELLTTDPIDHALFMTVPCTNGTHVPWLGGTGNGSVCTTDKANAPPLGQRFYLPYTDAEISALPTYARPWVRAMRDWGLYLGDTGGPADFGVSAALEGSNTYDSLGRANPINTWAAQVGLTKNSAGKYVLRLSSPSSTNSPIDWRRLRAIEP